jgi:peptidoglycan hydrolase-like protein with peptidoglycan-binding domain
MSGSSTQSSNATPAPMPQPLSSDTVRQVQTSLQRQGMYKGNIDGVWGPETQSALMAYQQAHGMAATGKLDAATMASLNPPSGGATNTTTQPAPAQTSSNAPSPSPAPSAPAQNGAQPSNGTTTQQ